MKAIAYLMGTTLKNALLELKKKPSRLILLLVMAALLGMMVFQGQASAPDLELRQDPAQLSAILLGLYLFLMVSVSRQGLSSGATFYTMADVNLLFQTPISPRRILIYGLVRQMGTSMLVGIFLLFQYSNVNRFYGVTMGGLILILLSYGMTVFCAQLTAMTVYTLTAGRERGKQIASVILYALPAVILAWVGLAAFRNLGNDPLSAAIAAADAPFMKAMPVVGWMQLASGAGMGRGLWQLGLGFLLAVVYCVVLIQVILHVSADFYEDVLQATEVSFQQLAAKKEGRVDMTPAKVKVGRTGLKGGQGASVFFYKHQLEDRRASIFLLDRVSLLMAAVTVLMAFFFRDAGIVAVVAMGAYLQLFSTMTGRWLRELALPYIYLVPESAFRRLLALCGQQMLRVAVDSLLVMIPAGLILGASPMEIAAGVLARAGFGPLYMGGNILCQRVLGGLASRALSFVFYFMILMVLLLPSVFVGLGLGFLLGIPAGLLGTAVCNVLLTALLLWLCRNMLDCAELNQ